MSEEALCFGWIDSLPGKIDAERYKLLVSPRKPGSSWSKVNRDRIARLEKAGRIAAPAREKIEAAKRDGSWSRLDAVERLEVPPDLRAAFSGQAEALRNFEGFAPSSRRGILEWLGAARKDDTRARRIEEIVRMAALGLRANFPVDYRKLKQR